MRLYHKKINRRKHYGIGVEQKHYRDLIRSLFDPADVDTVLGPYREPAEALRPQDVPVVIAQLGSPRFRDPVVLQSIAELLSTCFSKGSRRVFTKTGDAIAPVSLTNTAAVEALAGEQINYLKNIDVSIREKIRDLLLEGIQEGQPMDALIRDIKAQHASIVDHQAERLARSETIKASSLGQDQAMRDAGIEEYIWLSARDRRVCQPPRDPSRRHLKHYCSELDGRVFSLKDPQRPLPVRDTHPNCRCTLVANI